MPASLLPGGAASLEAFAASEFSSISGNRARFISAGNSDARSTLAAFRNEPLCGPAFCSPGFLAEGSSARERSVAFRKVCARFARR